MTDFDSRPKAMKQLLFLLVLITFSLPAVGQGTLLCHFGSPIPAGESTVSGRLGWTDIQSFAGGGSVPWTLSDFGGGRRNPSVFLTDISLTKPFNSQSLSLFEAMLEGTLLNSLEVELLVAIGPNPPAVAARVELEEVIITGVSWSASVGDPVSELVTCAFRTARFETFSQNPDGSYGGNGFVAYYDQRLNEGGTGQSGSPPTIGAVAAQTVPRNSTGNSFIVAIRDDDTIPDNLTVTATSLTEGVIPDASVGVTGTGTNRTVTFDTNDVINTGTIRVTVSDGVGSASKDVTIFVVNPASLATLNSLDPLCGAVGSVEPLTGIGISDPGASADFQLIVGTNTGQVAIPVDTPGGITSGQVTGNGTSLMTITATLLEINTTFADPNGLLYSTGTLANDQLSLTLSEATSPGTVIDSLTEPITVFADAYECWQELTFTPAELAAGIGIGELDDFDLDGTFNVIEFATGLDARNPSSRNPITMTISEVSGDKFIDISYDRKEPPGGLVYSLEIYNTGTGVWEATGSNAALIDGPTFINPRFQSVTYRITDPVIGDATLVRFRVTKL